MDDYITKPVKVEELIRVLNAFLSDARTEAVGVSPAAKDSSPVDLIRMHEVMGDEPQEFSEILDLYLETMSTNLDRLDQALKCGDHKEVELAAHNGAGTSANCGMTAVVDSLRELERAGREGQLANAPQALAEAKREFGRIQTFLESHMSEFAMQMETV
jgi:HPt (histidine-containing phosphotransfer) domain-containing protein